MLTIKYCRTDGEMSTVKVDSDKCSEALEVLIRIKRPYLFSTNFEIYVNPTMTFTVRKQTRLNPAKVWAINSRTLYVKEQKENAEYIYVSYDTDVCSLHKWLPNENMAMLFSRIYGKSWTEQKLRIKVNGVEFKPYSTVPHGSHIHFETIEPSKETVSIRFNDGDFREYKCRYNETIATLFSVAFWVDWGKEFVADINGVIKPSNSYVLPSDRVSVFSNKERMMKIVTLSSSTISKSKKTVNWYGEKTLSQYVIKAHRKGTSKRLIMMRVAQILRRFGKNDHAEKYVDQALARCSK